MNDSFYGTTMYGGKGSACTEGSVPGCGTVFKITSSGAESVLHSFKGEPDGTSPRASLVAINGTLYGTTPQGGSNNKGAVFAITTAGAERVLYSFKGGADGEYPVAGLISMKGALYGVTEKGGTGCGSYGCGTVFELTTSGKEQILYRFKGAKDGSSPSGSLIGVTNTLYGTTSTGGSGCAVKGGCGTVFSVSTSGKERLLYSFRGDLGKGPDGAYPAAGLLVLNGTLYGSTQYGGAASCSSSGDTCGTVFAVSTSGAERVLHRFGDVPDGAWPIASLIDLNGLLYGTTTGGGDSKCGNYHNGCGSIYELNTSGKERVLYGFKGDFNSGPDGSDPSAALIVSNGILYGTALQGGNSNCGPSGTGCGTVFRISP
jgi:uncharacterized repeat protein (TIGR03803 family)